MVVDMIDARATDGYVVAGTHGAGVFSTNITDTLLTGVPFVAQESTDINVYPNPADKSAVISWQPAVNSQLPVSGSNTIELKIFNSAGEIVFTKRYTTVNCTLPTADLPSGIYFIQLKTGEKTMVKRLVVEH